MTVNRGAYPFATQAAIAIRRSACMGPGSPPSELSQKVAQLEALGEVGQAVSSSLDPDQVLATIIMQAVPLSGTDGGSIFEYDDAEEAFVIRTAYGTSAALVDALRRTHIGLPTRWVGRAAKEAGRFSCRTCKASTWTRTLQSV